MHPSPAAEREWALCRSAMGDGIDASNFERPATRAAGQSSDLRAEWHALDDYRHTDESYGHIERESKGEAMNIDFPFHFNGQGRTGSADDDDHIRDMIEQLLFTSPGERVNRPDFGSGLLQMVFAPNSPELAAALQYTTQAALQRYLGDLIDLQSLEVTSQESTLEVVVKYVVKRTGNASTETFVRSAAGA